MNGLPYYKAYPRDFIEGTVGMRLELKGAYRIIIDLIYMQNGRLPDDPRYISGLLGCSIRMWKSLRLELVDAGKVEVSGEFLTNKRARNELETSAKYQDNQREKGAAPKKNKALEETTVKPARDYTEPDTYTEAIASVASQAKKRGSRLPDDWFLPKAWGDWAVSEGWHVDQIRLQADQFGDYWRSATGASATKLDWEATWRIWMRKTPKGQGNGKRTSDDRDDPTLRIIANAARMR